MIPLGLSLCLQIACFCGNKLVLGFILFCIISDVCLAAWICWVMVKPFIYLISRSGLEFSFVLASLDLPNRLLGFKSPRCWKLPSRVLCEEVLYKAEMSFYQWGLNKHFILVGRTSDFILKKALDCLLTKHVARFVLLFPTAKKWSGRFLCVQWPFRGSPSPGGEEVPLLCPEAPFPREGDKMAPSWEHFNCWMCRWLRLHLGDWNR